MFKNIGIKIRRLAAFFCWVGIVVSAIAGIILLILGFSEDEMFIVIALPILICGPLFSWVSSFLLYGFGQLIHNSEVIAKNTQQQSFAPAPYTPPVAMPTMPATPVAPYTPATPVAPYAPAAPAAPVAPAVNQRTCEGCGSPITNDICSSCGKVHGATAEKVLNLQKMLKEGKISSQEYNASIEQLKSE